MAFSYPVNAPITQYFGANPNDTYQPDGHYGMDFGVAVGTEIRAIGDGVVVWADWSNNLGANPWQMIPYSPNTGINVMIDHGDYVSIYAHLSDTGLNIGNRVKQGQVIGLSGNTGLSTGPHLHVEIIYEPHINGYMYGRVDPAKVMSTFVPVGQTVQKLSANQRLVGGANLVQRDRPAAAGREVRIVPANTVETFTGYVVGEEVNLGGVKSNIWYKDTQGYVWAGGFTEQKTAGLNNLTPTESSLTPAQRKVGPNPLSQRSGPATSSPVVRAIASGTIEVFKGYVRGQMVETGGVASDIWYTDDIGYVWAGGFTEQKTAGLPNKTDYLAKTVGDTPANLRKFPTADADVLATIGAGERFKITGYVAGDKVGDSNTWFKREPEGYIHASAVADAYLAQLKKLPTPVAAKPAPAPVPAPQPVPAPTPAMLDKVVVPEGVNLRQAPTTTATSRGVVPGGDKLVAFGYVDGEQIDDSKIWFEVPNGYVHVSGVTDPSTAGLEKKTAPVPATPEEDEEPPYEFTPDFDFVEYKPANTWNMQNGNFPVNPEKLVLHQFDDVALKPSIDGVTSHFQTPRPLKPSSAHFGVSGARIIQYVSLKDRAQHAGPIGNDYIGIEIDPQESAETVASVKKLISALNRKYGKVFTYTKHRDVPQNATECGKDIHLEKYAVPTTAPAPAPKPVPEEAAPTKEEIAKVLKYLDGLYT